jgi:hypothetical protein
MESFGLVVCDDQNGVAHSASSRWNTNAARSKSDMGQ